MSCYFCLLRLFRITETQANLTESTAVREKAESTEQHFKTELQDLRGQLSVLLDGKKMDNTLTRKRNSDRHKDQKEAKRKKFVQKYNEESTYGRCEHHRDSTELRCTQKISKYVKGPYCARHQPPDESFEKPEKYSSSSSEFDSDDDFVVPDEPKPVYSYYRRSSTDRSTLPAPASNPSPPVHPQPSAFVPMQNLSSTPALPPYGVYLPPPFYIPRNTAQPVASVPLPQPPAIPRDTTQLGPRDQGTPFHVFAKLGFELQFEC